VEYRKHVEYFFLSILVGIFSVGVAYAQKMSETLQKIAVSVEVITERQSSTDRQVQDHESRLRYYEQFGRKSR
jgi:ribose 5-phosphate isomerase